MVKIITPYINPKEIKKHKEHYWEYDIYYEQDTAGIGPDLMFQKMWNKFPDDDIFILHSDMFMKDTDWLSKVLKYTNKYPEAGMFGCLLLYPLKDEKGDYFIQSAGGKFTDGKPDHYGSGIVVENKSTFKEELETDTGEYDSVREVAWTTFGGCYIRRSFINAVGSFSPEYEWAYNRDVDFCLAARSVGQKIYQIPVRIMHSESKDAKIIKANDQSKVQMELRNLNKLIDKWSGSKLYKTIDNKII